MKIKSYFSSLLVLLLVIPAQLVFAQVPIRTIEISRELKVSDADLWKVVSDVLSYYKYNPTVDDISPLNSTKPSEGLVRQCKNSDGTWQETITSWQPGNSYTFKTNTQHPDYPYPLDKMDGTVIIKRTPTDNKTIVTMKFDYQFKNSAYDFMGDNILRKRMSKALNETIDNWEREAVMATR